MRINHRPERWTNDAHMGRLELWYYQTSRIDLDVAEGDNVASRVSYTVPSELWK